MRFLLSALLVFPCLAADWNPRAAAEYLDGRQKEWAAWPAADLAGGGKCVSCHTGMTYLLARPALRRALNEPKPTEYETAMLETLRARVATRTPLELYPKLKEPHLSEETAVEAVFAALFLKSGEAFDRMWSLQTAGGAWRWNSFELDPWETPESAYFGASLAALALKSAPATERDRPQTAKLKEFVEREFGAQPLHNRLMAMWAGAAPAVARKTALDELWRTQSADGGWPLEALGPWKTRESAPTASGSNAYATAFAAVALEKAGVSDGRLRRALEWLKTHQNAAGYWDAVSMNKVRQPESMAAGFMRDAATAYASMALVEGR